MHVPSESYYASRARNHALAAGPGKSSLADDVPTRADAVSLKQLTFQRAALCAAACNLNVVWCVACRACVHVCVRVSDCVCAVCCILCLLCVLCALYLWHGTDAVGKLVANPEHNVTAPGFTSGQTGSWRTTNAPVYASLLKQLCVVRVLCVLCAACCVCCVL